MSEVLGCIIANGGKEVPSACGSSTPQFVRKPSASLCTTTHNHLPYCKVEEQEQYHHPAPSSLIIRGNPPPYCSRLMLRNVKRNCWHQCGTVRGYESPGTGIQLASNDLWRPILIPRGRMINITGFLRGTVRLAAWMGLGGTQTPIY
jgi:hypothetical protein